MEHTHLPLLNSGQAYSRQTEENPPYEGGWMKIGYHQEGRDEPEFSKPGLALRWPHPCFLPIEWGSRGCPPNVNLRPRVVLDTQVWLPARNGDGRSHLLLKALCFVLEFERKTKTLEGKEAEQQTPGNIRAGETRWNQQTCSPHYVNSPRMSVALGDPPCLGGWPLIKINSLHNNIWFDFIIKRRFLLFLILLIRQINYWINHH